MTDAVRPELVDPCLRCGQQHFMGQIWADGRRLLSCRAHLTKPDAVGNLVPCGLAPLKGMDICRVHGGKARQARAAAKRRMDREAQERAVRAAAQIYGIPRAIDPAEGLVEEYWRCAGLVAAYERLASGLTVDDLTFGIISETVKTTPAGALALGIEDGQISDFSAEPTLERTVKRGAQINIIVKYLNDERKRFTELGVKIVELGLEARRDEYVRAQVAVFASVLGALGLSPEQRLMAAQLLRQLDGNAARAIQSA